jgi:hypothetical protein
MCQSPADTLTEHLYCICLPAEVTALSAELSDKVLGHARLISRANTSSLWA